MAIYPEPPPHERLNVFFGDFFREMRKAPPQAYGQFLMRAEEEFTRTGYRDKNAVGGVENILIVRIDAIGDMILTSGFIREVRANFPSARITLVCSPLAYPLVELCPYVNEVLTFDIKALSEDFPEMLGKIAVFCRDNLWQKKFSLAFSPLCGGKSFPGLVMMWLSGARERVGYISFNHDRAINSFLLNNVINLTGNLIAQVDKMFHILTSIGLKVNQTHMELFYGAEDSRRAKELLEDLPPDCKKVVVGIGAGDASRQYPAKKLAVALKKLAKRDLAFVIIGGKSEADDANFIEQNLPQGKVLNLAGKTTLRETEAVIAQMDYYIGNDSGVMHMAAAAKVPVLTIYREAVDRENVAPSAFSEYLNFPPWQTKSVVLRPEHPLGDCATLPPCYGHCHHKEAHCITQITPQQIIDDFEKLTTL